MRILLDSRDLIDVLERQRAPTFAELEQYLLDNNHQIVLCFSNIRELVSPVAEGVSYLEIRPHLQSLERLPHTYIQEVAIVGLELEAGVQAFNTGSEFAKPSPYVDRWDRTLSRLPGKGRPVRDFVVNLSLDNLVYETYMANPPAFLPPHDRLPELKRILASDRDLLRAGKLPAREHFITSIRQHAATHRVELPRGREDEFATWVYRDPNRCPGLRLNHEIFRSFTANYGDAPEASDFTDLALTFMLPYVEASTLDRRIRDYCQRACKKLAKLRILQDYRQHVFDDVGDLIRRLN